MSLLVYCHPCARQTTGRRNSLGGDVLCSVCNSDFCEVVEAPAPVSTRSTATPTSEVFVSSFTIDANGATAPSSGDASQPRAQVMIIQETIPIDMDSIHFQMGQGGRGRGIQLGDYASPDQIDNIMARLLQTYAPPRQPTSQSFIDKLPRLPVRPPEGSDASGGTIGASSGADGESNSGNSAENSETRRYACCSTGEACTVCHEAYRANEVVVELPCHHCFHEACLMPWLTEHNTCPVCRRKFESETHSLDSHPQAATTATATPQTPHTSTTPNAANERTTAQGNIASPQDIPGQQYQARHDQQQRASPAATEPNASARPLQQQIQMQVLRGQHAILRNQHAALQIRLREVQQTCQEQLSLLLVQQQQQSSDGQPVAAQPASSPLADLSDQLRNAQRAVDQAHRLLRNFEARMARVASRFQSAAFPGAAVPGATRQEQSRAGGAAGTRTDSGAQETMTTGLGEGASSQQRPQQQRSEGPRPVHWSHNLRRALARQRDGASRRDGQSESSEAGSSTDRHEHQHRQRRAPLRAARSPSTTSTQQQHQHQHQQPGVVGVDAVLSVPLFAVQLSHGPMPLDMFVQPLAEDEDLGPRGSNASRTSDTAAGAAAAEQEEEVPTPVGAVGEAVSVSSSAPKGPDPGAPVQGEAAAVRPAPTQQVRETRVVPVGSYLMNPVVGLVTFPWRMVAAAMRGAWGLLFNRPSP